jgi:hypothetical protein
MSFGKSKQTNRVETIFLSVWLNYGFGTIIGATLSQPRENIWSDHAVVEYNGKVYDPSYGVNYGSGDTAKQNFINQLDSIGNRVSTVSLIVGYGVIYTPTKNTSQILISDLIFSW